MGSFSFGLQRNVDPLLEQIEYKQRKRLDEASNELFQKHRHLWRSERNPGDEYCDWWFKNIEEMEEVNVAIWDLCDDIFDSPAANKRAKQIHTQRLLVTGCIPAAIILNGLAGRLKRAEVLQMAKAAYASELRWDEMPPAPHLNVEMSKILFARESDAAKSFGEIAGEIDFTLIDLPRRNAFGFNTRWGNRPVDSRTPPLPWHYWEDAAVRLIMKPAVQQRLGMSKKAVLATNALKVYLLTEEIVPYLKKTSKTAGAAPEFAYEEMREEINELIPSKKQQKEFWRLVFQRHAVEGNFSHLRMIAEENLFPVNPHKHLRESRLLRDCLSMAGRTNDGIEILTKLFGRKKTQDLIGPVIVHNWLPQQVFTRHGIDDPGTAAQRKMIKGSIELALKPKKPNNVNRRRAK